MDVKPILDAALAGGGGVFETSTPGQAIRFRQRCYEFRKAYREAIAPAPSPYDALTIPTLPEGARSVFIRPITPKGTFTPAGGPSIEAAPEVDDLLAEAEALKFKLDLE